MTPCLSFRGRVPVSRFRASPRGPPQGPGGTIASSGVRLARTPLFHLSPILPSVSLLATARFQCVGRGTHGLWSLAPAGSAPRLGPAGPRPSAPLSTSAPARARRTRWGLGARRSGRTRRGSPARTTAGTGPRRRSRGGRLASGRRATRRSRVRGVAGPALFGTVPGSAGWARLRGGSSARAEAVAESACGGRRYRRDLCFTAADSPFA